MANKTTAVLTKEQYESIIGAMRKGSSWFRPNEKAAMALILEANLGMRIEDTVNMRLCDIVSSGDVHRLQVTEKKTGKRKDTLVPEELYDYICAYCERNKIKKEEPIVSIGVRAIQKYLAKVADYLGYENIGTHSFRKYYGSDCYNLNNHDIIQTMRLLNHSSPYVTQRYIGITSADMDGTLEKHFYIP